MGPGQPKHHTKWKPLAPERWASPDPSSLHTRDSCFSTVRSVHRTLRGIIGEISSHHPSLSGTAGSDNPSKVLVMLSRSTGLGFCRHPCPSMPQAANLKYVPTHVRTYVKYHKPQIFTTDARTRRGRLAIFSTVVPKSSSHFRKKEAPALCGMRYTAVFAGPLLLTVTGGNISTMAIRTICGV